MNYSILIIEDEQDLADILHYNFTKAGYSALIAKTGEEAFDLLGRPDNFDLVILDLMLPDISGLDICIWIRKKSKFKNLPVLMLTAKSEEGDRVTGFEAGADDYVTKPFSIKELLLRIKALLKRSKRESQDDEIIHFGMLSMDFSGHRVWVNRTEKNLTALEFNLLKTLFKRKGRVQTREVLLNDVWDINADVTTRTVDTHVKRLREKLKEGGSYIETVRGVGYRFIDKAELKVRSGELPPPFLPGNL
jgi:two-component system phosphate regulon response regulator PhoB